MAVFDLKDAYLVVSIAGTFVMFLKFHWRFGLTSAPRKFTKLLKPILSYLRRQGITIVTYIDDAWVRGNTFLDCYNSVVEAMKKFCHMGFLINVPKSRPMPSQSVTILGFIVDSVTMLITLPQEKIHSTMQLIQSHLSNRHTTARALAKLIGTLIAIFPTCPLGRAHYRSLERIKLTALNANAWNWNTPCFITQAAVRDLKWWLRTLPTTSAPIRRSNPDMVMFTDASKQGWVQYSKVSTLRASSHNLNDPYLSSNRILEYICSTCYGRIAHRAIMLTTCQPQSCDH